jgi:hypothetical protein
MERKDGALIDRQTPKTALEAVSFVHRKLAGIQVWRVADQRQRDHGSAVRLTDLRVATADEDPAKPALEPIDVAEPWQIAPHGNERLLERIVGAVRVAKDPLGEREHAVAVRPGEGREGVTIALLCADDEVSIHPSRSWDDLAVRPR